MLIGINKLISPKLLKILMEMGHGDEIVFGDSNFPAASHAKRLIRADGHNITEMLDALLPLLPLDYAVEYSAVLMNCGDTTEMPIWNKYKEIFNLYPNGNKRFLIIPKPEFYERAKKAYCVVATSESESFANLIIRKGVIR